jgi:hypothetical protein
MYLKPPLPYEKKRRRKEKCPVLSSTSKRRSEVVARRPRTSSALELNELSFLVQFLLRIIIAYLLTSLTDNQALSAKR